MGKKRSKIYVVMLVMLLLSGCGLDEKIIEDLAFIQTKGYDLVLASDLENGEEEPIYQLTTAAPLVDPDRTEPKISRTTTTRLNKEGVQRNDRTTEREMVSGQLRLLLYSQILAEQGLQPLLDVLERDPEIPIRTKLAIVEGEVKPLIAREYDEHPRTTVYLNELLEKESRFNIIPETRVYQFFRDLKDDSRDPVMPMITLEEDNVAVSGLALLENDTYITKLALDDALFFFMLERPFNQGELNISIPNPKTEERELVSFTSLSADRDFNVVKRGESFEVTIKMDIRGMIYENIGAINIAEAEGQHKLENLIEQYIKEKAEEIIAYTQEHSVDPIGIGTHIRNNLSYQDWQSLDWREEWPNVQVDCDVEVDIRDFGMRAGG